MADLTVTRFGPLETALALATQQSIAIYARAALLALNDVHFRLGIDYTSSGYSPASEPPTGRWSELINSLLDIDRTSWPIPSPAQRSASRLSPSDVFPSDFTVELRDALSTASHSSRAAVARLLTEAGTFLIAESIELFSQVELATTVGRSGDRTLMTAQLDEVTAAGRKLLDHTSADNLETFFFGDLAPEQASTTAAATPEALQPSVNEPSSVNTFQAPDLFEVAAKTLRNHRVVILVGSSLGKRASVIAMLQARRVLFEKAMSHGMAGEACIAIAVSPSTGALTDPIYLMPPHRQFEDQATEPVEWLGAALMQFEHQVTSLIADTVSDLSENRCSNDPVARWMELVECFDGFGRIQRPDHVLVLVEEPQEDVARTASSLTAVPPQELVMLLREDGLIPNLTGTSVTVVHAAGSGQDTVDLHQHWLAICSAANALSCEFDLTHHDATVPDKAGTPPSAVGATAEFGNRSAAVVSSPQACSSHSVVAGPHGEISTVATVGLVRVQLRRTKEKNGQSSRATSAMLVTSMLALVHIMLILVIGGLLLSAGKQWPTVAPAVVALTASSTIMLSRDLRGISVKWGTRNFSKERVDSRRTATAFVGAPTRVVTYEPEHGRQPSRARARRLKRQRAARAR